MLPRWNTGGQAVSKAARVDWSTISSACSYLGSMLFPPLVGPKPPRYARSKIDGTALQRRSKARTLSSRSLICPNPGAVDKIFFCLQNSPTVLASYDVELLHPCRPVSHPSEGF